MFDFTINPLSDSVVVVQVTGRLADLERDYFFSCIGDLVNNGYRYVIVECHGLGLISSSGLAVLLKARKRASKKGGQVYFTHLSSTISEVLEMTKLGRLLAVYPTTESVIESIETNELACVG